jgi:anthranilate phosphoribosyltransferase
MITEAIRKLMEKQNLTSGESKTVMEQIMSGDTSPVKMSAYLIALRQKGESVDEILGSAQAMREKLRRINHRQEKLVDNCGTGGDGSGTFNISTTTTFSVSSQCGSADLLQALGVDITLTPEQVGKCIDEIGLGFMFAPALHPAMKEVAPIRKELACRTIFNILGPLTNPAFATHQMIGVFDVSYAERLALVTQRLGIKKAFIVHNLKGVDELTTAGLNLVVTASNDTASNINIDPRQYGFEECTLNDLKGGDAKENAGITISILGGEKSPRGDTVVLNAAVGLMAAEVVDKVEDGIKIANECIASGKALSKLKAFVAYTNDVRNAAAGSTARA